MRLGVLVVSALFVVLNRVGKAMDWHQNTKFNQVSVSLVGNIFPFWASFEIWGEMN